MSQIANRWLASVLDGFVYESVGRPEFIGQRADLSSSQVTLDWFNQS